MSSCRTLQFTGKLPSLYEGRVDTMVPPYCVHKARCVLHKLVSLSRGSGSCGLWPSSPSTFVAWKTRKSLNHM